MTQANLDTKNFRNILGHYPTGVCVVTAMQENGAPCGMAVGSFTSVSLAPPLVGFFPDKSSSTWPKIEGAGRFCVNVLSDDQAMLCQRFASKAEDKFQDVSHRLSDAGLPILDDVLVWIDCRLHAVHEAGDHFLVLGEVEAFAIEQQEARPLIFFQGGYGQFEPMAI